MNNYLMIRLIDVALIILLGFIAISRLKTEYVDLSSSARDFQTLSQKPHFATIHVYQNYSILEDGKRRWKCTTVRKLENTLISQRNGYEKQRVQLIASIEPHKSCIMQKLVDVLDVCQRNNIEKNLKYESTE